MTEILDETAQYRLAKKSNLWIAFTPNGQGSGRTWQMQVSLRSRGGAKTLAVLLETTPLRPLATVTIQGETYPLTIARLESRRGGVLIFGGERKTGADGGTIAWEMHWRPVASLEGSYRIALRVRASPRSAGDLQLHWNTPLHQPSLWSLAPAALRGHCAVTAYSEYSRHTVGFTMLDGPEEAGWDEAQGGFTAKFRAFPFGGGKTVHFGLQFLAAKSAVEARGPLLAHYAALADPCLHPLESAIPLDSAEAVSRLSDPGAYEIKGAERLYWKTPGSAPDAYYAGFPHYPLDALKALWDWHRFHAREPIARLVRFGTCGVAADFQVMGRSGGAEPNKGAFWDKRTGDLPTDYRGEPTHGIAANARIARALFLIYEASREPLFRQSALNICQWLILKQNAAGYFDGERVHATRGRADDGKFLPDPCTLDGAEALRPLILAFRETANEVFVKAAWKIANHLLGPRLHEFEMAPPPAVAGVIAGLIALDGEAPNERLRAALRVWGAWLRALPLHAAEMNADGLHSGLFECAHAGFLLHALERDPAYLRYGFAALAAVPAESHAASWHSLDSFTTALLSLTCVLPDASPDFDALSVALGWRVFAPDPATEQFLHVTAADGSSIDYLPLVCRLNDQLLLIVLGSAQTEAVTILKNGRRPLVRDLLTDALDSAANLHSFAGEQWARVGLFTIDP